MPWYSGNIPTNWESAIERYNGAEFVLDIIFDPEGENVILTDSHDVTDISSINISKELDPEFGITPTIGDISITFNDPDHYFNPEKSSSVFYGYTPVGKTIVARLRNVAETTVQTITLFTGKIDRLPQLKLGFATLICSDRRKYILNQKLIGADSATATKLMTMNSAGGLVSSVTYSNTWNSSPYEFELTGGSLPTGLTLSSEGAIDGTPAESGTFSFTVKVTNAIGEYHTLDCEIYVDANFNSHFLEALGLGDFTEVDKSTTTSLATNPSWYRVTFNGTYKWGSANDDAPHLYITGADGISGDWTLYGKVKNGFDGQNYNHASLYIRLGANDGYFCGCRSTASAGTFNLSVVRVYDNNEIYNTAIANNPTIWVKIKRVSTTYYFYYRLADSGAWTTIGSSTRAGTPTQVGFMVIAAVAGNGYGEIDQLYYYDGVLVFTSNNTLPTAAVGVDYSYFLKVEGGGGEYAYELTDGGLPTGLALNEDTGEISGTPTESQSCAFTVTVSDGNGDTTDNEFSLTVSDKVYITPSVLPDGADGEAYTEIYDIYGDGTFDRSVVTIGSRCELGLWNITFLTATSYQITGPGISKQIGHTDEDFVITNVITIPTTGWAGNFLVGDYVEFVTGISRENTNAVSLLYDIYTDFGIENKYLDCSSFFGDKEIGTLADDMPGSPNLVANGGFETYTGTQDDGTSDTFTSWTATVAAGQIADSTATAYSGSSALKFIYTSGTAGALNVYQTINVSAVTKYRLSFYTRGTGTDAVEYSIYDLSNSAYLKVQTTTNIKNQTTYTYFSYDFTTSAGCAQIFIAIFAPSTYGTSYVDYVRLSPWLDIDINVVVPTVIKTGETLTISGGGNSENIQVLTGNADSTSFPPYITLSVAEYENAYSGGSTATWADRGEKDIDFSFDRFWWYCEQNKFKLSITFDRSINALGALELVGMHAGIYVMHSRGVERVAGLIKRWTETLSEITDSTILANSVQVDSVEVFNDFSANYGYDYINKEYTKVYRYPETDAGNASYMTHGYKREKKLDLPGYYSEAVVETLLENLYNVFSDGLKLISFEADLKTLLCQVGERYDVDFSYPDIDTEIEIFGYTLNLLKKYSVILKAVDRSHLTEAESPYLLMPDDTPMQMPDGTYIRRPETW